MKGPETNTKSILDVDEGEFFKKIMYLEKYYELQEECRILPFNESGKTDGEKVNKLLVQALRRYRKAPK